MKVKSFIKKYTMVLALVVVFIFFTILTDGKLVLAQNISNLLLQNAYVLVMACGMLLCILTGGNVDLSVGSTLCLSAGLAAKIMDMGKSPFLAIVVSLAVSVVIGVWQGWLIGYIHIPPFICTLAGMFLFRGLARVVLDSRTISVMNDKFNNLFTSYIQISGVDEKGNCKSAIVVGIVVAVALLIYTFISMAKKKKQGIAGSAVGSLVKIIVIDVLIVLYAIKLSQYKGIPVMLIWILVVVLIFAFFTSSTVFGRYFYAVGGNEKATKLSGIDTNKVYFLAYTNMGFLAALAGMITIARLTSAQPTYGQNYEMDAIGSCFIGGASAYGGIGTVPGVIVGAVLMGVINLGMSLMGVDANMQKVVKGAVLLAAVIFDVVSKRGGKMIVKN